MSICADNSGFHAQNPVFKADLRQRGTHSTVCKNRSPEFVESQHYKNPPAFIRDLIEKSHNADVTRSDASVWSHSLNGRQRRIYEDRAKAINALHECFSRHVNLATMQVNISLRNASDACGLTTTSQNELNKADPTHENYIPDHTPVVSISRASRAFRDMIELGMIRAEKQWQVWDKNAGAWVDKVFEVTQLFFEAVGITAERVEKQQNARLAYLGKNGDSYTGLTAEQVGMMSLNELKEFGRHAWRRAAFERRSKQQKLRKDKRVCKKADNAGSLRQEAIRRVQESLGGKPMVDLQQFKRLVNLEIASLRRASAPPPQ